MTELDRTLVLSMIDQDNAVLASTDAAIAVALESEAIASSQVEKANHVLNAATSHRFFAENLETLRVNAQRIRESIARKMAMLSAVRLLPAELIEHIALNARDSLLFPSDPTSVPLYPTKFMLGLLAVCSRWRKAIRGSPRVWQILPMQPSRQGSINLVTRLRPLVGNSQVHWWLYVRSTQEGFNDDMETFENTYSDCQFEDGQFKSLTLVFERIAGHPSLRLRAPPVTTLVMGITPRPACDTSPKSDYSGPVVYLEPGVFPALKTLELGGIALDLRKMEILPHLRTFVSCASPNCSVLDDVLERSPQLSTLKIDHCIYKYRTESIQRPRRDLPILFLAITTLELDLIGINTILENLVNSLYLDYEFREPIKKLTLTNHLYRVPSPTPSGYMPDKWGSTKVEYGSWKAKSLLSKIHGVERLYLRTGGGAILDSEVPFTFRFQTDNLAPLRDVEELVLQCAAGCADEVRVTLEGLQQDGNLFPRLRKIRLERCKTMTSVWEQLMQTVRVRKRIEKVEFMECAVVPEARAQLDDLLAARRI